MTNVARMEPVSKSDGTELTTVTMTVTPQMAQDWLDAMPVQRRVRGTRVRLLARLITEGRWRVLPHGIVFNHHGILIDGQHRLMAIVEAGKSVQVRATFNADPGMFMHIDGGSAPKGLEDILRHDGVSKELTMLLPRAIRMLFAEGRGRSPLGSNDVVPSHEEAMEEFRRHPLLIDAGAIAAQVRVAPSRAVLVYFVYKGFLISRPRTEEFCEQLKTGEYLAAGDPALLLRNTWFKERAARIKRSPEDQSIMIAHPLNAVLKGKKMHSWRGVEFGKGKLPKIGG